MSRWTQIVAAIEIDTWKNKRDIKKYVEDIIKKSPSITGSEGNADIFVNIKSGHNLSIGRDQYQTRLLISIVGNLRDRECKTTKREFFKFLTYLVSECKFDIDNYTYKIME